MIINNMDRNQLYLLISIIEAIYVVYILRYFKTKILLDCGNVINYLGLNNNKYFAHQIFKTEVPVNHICPFGHQMAFVIAFYLVARVCLIDSPKYKKKINYLVLFLIFVGSFMNFNAFVYLIPFFILELFLNIKLI